MALYISFPEGRPHKGGWANLIGCHGHERGGQHFSSFLKKILQVTEISASVTSARREGESGHGQIWAIKHLTKEKWLQ